MPDSPADATAHALTLPRGATVLVFGASDTGKTTWAAEAVRAFCRAGKSVAVVDCDLGQSEIGPPGTVGVGIAEPGTHDDLRALRDLPPLSAYFVGAISPARHTLEWCVAACQMARVGRKRGPDIMIVDTCGWVQGQAAVTGKRRLADLLLPHFIYAFHRGTEIDPLLRSFAHLAAPEIRRIEPEPVVGRKTPAARSTRRTARFMAAFSDAKEFTLSWDNIALVGTRLGVGEAVPHHIRQFIGQSLRLPVLHAEQQLGGIYIVVNGEKWDASGLAALESYFRTTHVAVVPAQKFAGLYVGLISVQNTLLDIGLISRLDFSARTITLRTPCRRPAAVAQVWMGAVRLRADGREKGDTRPGDI